MNSPLVSIIIPAYNSEKYIGATIQNALRQTWMNKEIIVIDDGSTDHTLSILMSYENQDIKILTQANNGASSARNLGLSIATGDFVQFLDADDLLENNKIELQIRKLLENPDSIAFGSCTRFNTKANLHLSNRSLHSFISELEQPIELIKKIYGCDKNIPGSMIETHAWLAPTNIIKKAGLWNEELSYNDDGEFFLRVILHAKSIIYLPDAVALYRKDDKNTLSTLSGYKSLLSSVKALNIMSDTLKNYLSPKEYFYCFHRSYREVELMSFPAHKELSTYCRYKRLQISKFSGIYEASEIKLGGGVINAVAKYLNWRLARYLQYIKKYLGI
ncbi:glycosyltransferase family 2 protein [Pedobacter sp. Leaf176]|uniref:glycosyltransferase family 2 protein n=1 Tax=Pedobacter sp. Leaf176 TaxID=1736286 RepID=UPI0007009555|nr:glycosyltransferase family 2 protein [Pedobacter sp. Leaf176]KQR72692.1 hypothetical protein ASF92_05305 [Pedobacter sp. Leaf176]